MPPDIFISYRIADTLSQAGRLHQSLETYFGAGTAFYDKNSLKPGMKWPKELEEKVKQAKVVLMLYGNGDKWLGVKEFGLRRIDDPSDWVRREIETAIEGHKLLIPVLLQNAQLPPKGALPPSLHPLLDCQKREIREAEWGNDLMPLLQEIEKLVPRHRVTESAPPPLDPLENLPLPAPPAYPPPEFPYKGLTWFTDADARIFFGREEEIAELYKTKLEDSYKHIVLFYGQSGAGKSSLLHAGLFPRLIQQGWAPTYRRCYMDGSTAAIVEKYIEELQVAQPERPLLILDQLEEVFTQPQALATDEASQLPGLLRRLLDAAPNLRILLSFREDYLSPVTDTLRKGGIPFLEQRLRVMQEAGLQRAVAGIPGGELKNHYRDLSFSGKGDDLPERIARDLCAYEDSRSNAGPLLQFVLRKMWDEVAAHESPVFSWALYQKHRHHSVAALLQSQVEALRATHAAAVESGLVWDVLREFVTRENTAGQHTLQYLAERYEHLPANEITALCQALRDHYLLSTFANEDGLSCYRLAHDALAPVILALFTESSAPGQRARLILESKLKGAGIPLLSDVLFSRMDLEIIRQGRPGMYALLEEWEIAIQMAEHLYETERKKDEQQRRDIANFYWREAKKHLYELHYEKAYFSIAQALSLDSLHDKLATVLMEIAFVEAEGGNRKLVFDCIARLREISGKELPTDHLEPLQGAAFADGVHAVLETLHLEYLRDNLRVRYYPDMAPVPGGRFVMEEGKDAHEVSLSGFSLAQVPTTWEQFYLFCIATERLLPDAPQWGIAADNPVVNVSWYDAVEYANWLSGRFGLEKAISKNSKDQFEVYLKAGYRLPTEAEWEYAARGGEQGVKDGFEYAGSNDIDEVAWYDENSAKPDGIQRTRGVYNTKKTNQLGIFHLSGNAWEWCWDWYGSYPSVPQADPVGPGKGSRRVLRGSSWSDFAEHCRVSYRDFDDPDYRSVDVGFRVVLFP
jgi:formylglycine-generating enzyme required for sulfatase activity